MNEIDLSRLSVPGGFFVLRDQQPRPFDWSEPTKSTWRFLGTYCNSGTPLRDSLVSMIDSAKHRVFVVSFLLGDEVVIEALLRAAERMKGGVYVITALDEDSLSRGMREIEEDDSLPEECKKRFEQREERKKHFGRLTQGGIYVRGHSNCHAKLAIVDSHAAIIGSANFVKNGFEWTNEACIQVNDALVVADVIRLFSDLWHRGCEWEIPPGDTYSVAERQPTESPIDPPAVDRSSDDLVWTDGPRARSLLSAIHAVIDSAAHNLVLSSYSIVGMRQSPELLIEPVANAISRGVNVRFLVRQRNAYPGQMEDLLALHDLGVEIFADTRNHAKVVVADVCDAVIFSANFDAKHGLTSGVEAGVRVTRPEVVREVCRYIDHAVAEADTHFIRNPSQLELDGRLAARWCKEWRNGKDMEVGLGEEDWRRFHYEAGHGPVLFESAAENRCDLYAGNVVLQLSTDGTASQSQHANLIATDQPSSIRLHEWLRSVRQRRQDSIPRGFCTARIRWKG